jgi:hypothetical protein
MHISDLGSFEYLRYNFHMDKIMDSGRSKRYARAFATDDEQIKKAISASRMHIFSKKQKDSEYKLFIPFITDILDKTENKIEKAIIFDEKGKKIFEKYGTKSSVSFTIQELNQMSGYRLIHNHPSGNTLSYQDIVLAINSRLKEIIAISDKYIYRLKISKTLNIDEIAVKYKEAKMIAEPASLRLYKKSLFTKEQLKLEFEHMIMSIFSDITKGVSYEQTKYK